MDTIENNRSVYENLRKMDRANPAANADMIQAICDLGAEAIPALIQSLNDFYIGKHAAWVLSKMGSGVLPHLLIAMPRNYKSRDYTDTNAKQALVLMGSKAVPALIGALNDKELRVRMSAAEVLKEIGVEAAEAIPALIQATEDKSCDIQHYCIRALSMVARSEAIVPRLLWALDDESLRETIGWAFRDIGKRGVPALLSAWRDDDLEMCKRAAWALQHIGEDVGSLLEAAVGTESNELYRRNMITVLMHVNPVLAMAIIDQDQKRTEGSTEWDKDAGRKMKELKIFYLVFRAYMEGAASMNEACEMLVLGTGRIRQLEVDKIPMHKASYPRNILKIEPLFSKILDRPTFSMFTVKNWKEKEGDSYKFTEDAQNAWKWTDGFLRRQPILKDWFGFSRLKETE